MGRPPNVSRTFRITIATIICLDTKTNEPFEKVVEFPRLFRNERQVLKWVKTEYETESIKVVYIQDIKVKRMHYTMSEKKFIENAETVVEI